MPHFNRQKVLAEVEQITLRNAEAVKGQVEQIDQEIQASILAVSAGDAGLHGQSAAKQVKTS